MSILNKVNSLLSEAETIKIKHPQIWIPEFDELVAQLHEIKDLSNVDMPGASDRFSELGILKTGTFGDYIKTKNVKAVGCKFGTVQKQAKRKKKCPQCECTETEWDSVNNIYICSNCKSTVGKKQNSQLVTKDTNNESKHISKQLNIISGTINNPPAHVLKVMPFIIKWFNEKQHLLKWLKYTNTYTKFINHYYKEIGEKIDEEWFNQPVIQGLEHLCTYVEFKMICDEFYKLTLMVSEFNNFNSNISLLPDEQQIEICKRYYEKYKRLPARDEIFECNLNEIQNKNKDKTNNKKSEDINNKKYEIGKYIIHHMINDINSKTELKQHIEEIFNTKILLPGLIFEFIDVCGAKGNILKKYNYQQNYIFIIKQVYDVSLPQIVEADRQKIVELMIDFNRYVKEIKSNEEESKNHNACLWQVVLSLILSLHYYRCYADIINVLPTKSISTSLGIKENWSNYLIHNYDRLKFYITTLRTKVEKTSQATLTVSKKKVNMKKVFNFINGVGDNFDNDETDKYLKRKLNINVDKAEWAKNADLYDENYEGIEGELLDSDNEETEINLNKGNETNSNDENKSSKIKNVGATSARNENETNAIVLSDDSESEDDFNLDSSSNDSDDDSFADSSFKNDNSDFDDDF